MDHKLRRVSSAKYCDIPSVSLSSTSSGRIAFFFKGMKLLMCWRAYRCVCMCVNHRILIYIISHIYPLSCLWIKVKKIFNFNYLAWTHHWEKIFILILFFLNYARQQPVVYSSYVHLYLCFILYIKKFKGSASQLHFIKSAFNLLCLCFFSCILKWKFKKKFKNLNSNFPFACSVALISYKGNSTLSSYRFEIL